MKLFTNILIVIVIITTFSCKKIKLISESDITSQDDTTSIKFLVLGDWGQYGNDAQKRVSDAMVSICGIKKIDFIVSAGDNFYENGVASVTDSHWVKSYENVYPKDKLGMNWYPVFGNHDYLGNLQAQFEYSNISDRWKFQTNCYDLWLNENEIHLMFIDTSPYEPEYNSPAPEFVNTSKADTAKMSLWMDSVFNLPAKNKIVIGHHPVYTSGVRYNITSVIRSRLLPKMIKANIDAYITGHEHHLEHAKANGVDTDFFISGGGGAGLRNVSKFDYTQFVKSSHGFLLVELDKQKTNYTFYSDSCKQLYSYSRNN